MLDAWYLALPDGVGPWFSSLPSLLGYYVNAFDPFLVRFNESVGIRWYGLSYVLSFLFGYLAYRKLARAGLSDLPESKVADFITLTALCGVILGGRLGYFLFYQPGTLLSDPLEFFRLQKGGMASHGGILGIIIFTWFYARAQRVSWTNLGDNLVVVSPIGLFLVRCANFINGELYGRVTDVSWAMKFPRELEPSLPPGTMEQALRDPNLLALLADRVQPRHPSQLYEAALEGIALFTILWFMRTRLRLPNGVLTAAFFILYAVFRILCEAFREPDSELIGPFTKGQFYSFFMILIGLAFLTVSLKWRTYPKGKSEIRNPKSEI